MNIKPDVLVIGLGAMGAAVTYQLARRGAKVIGIDQFSPPHDRGSTHGETRITRQAIGEGLHFVPLAIRSHQLWREIEEASGENILNECGGLIMARTGQTGSLHGQKDFLKTTIDAATSYDITHEVLNAVSINERFPQFEINGDERGYFESSAGFLNPEKCVSAQLNLAGALGAELITGQKASLRYDASKTIVECNGTIYQPENTVIAAGPWLSQLLPEFALRLKVSRQVLFWFDLDGSIPYRSGEFPIFIWHWGSGPNDHFYGFPQVGTDKVIKIATEQTISTTTPQTMRRRVSDREITDMAETHIAGKLRGVTSRCQRAVACLYTSTADSSFIIDRLPERADTVVVSPCSGHGFKHSAAIGEAVAEMVLSGKRPEVLRPFGLGKGDEGNQ